MSMDYTKAYCRDCCRRVRAERRGTSHVLHLLLTVLTGCLWLPIWILSCVKFGGWMCPLCGGSKLQFKTFGIGKLPK